MSASEFPNEKVSRAAEDHPPSVRAKALPLAPPDTDASSYLVPARMINEVLYCERLMFLEWVQNEWADNRYTAEGTAVHKRVDKGSKPLKKLETSPEDDRPYTARSVWLSSERLGITGKMDVVEVEGSTVVPVEYKRGKQPKLGAYLPERAQVAAQVMLLRDHGYECAGGEIYYAGERRRVPIQMDADLEGVVLRAVARARELVDGGKCPPPLSDSPKCVGCSLSGICLPDEVHALQEEEPLDDDASVFDVGDDPWGLAGPEPEPEFEQPSVRRLFPARDDKVPLYVQDRGASIRLEGGRLVVATPGTSATMVRLSNTSSVTLYGNVQITTQALRSLMDEGIPVLFATSGGWLVGRGLGTDSKNVQLRRAQYRSSEESEKQLEYARAFVKAKVLNCRTLLRRNHKGDAAVTLGELKQLARKVDDAAGIDSLLGIEGTAARAYFRAFSGMLKDDVGDEFQFDRRNRRPPTDPINALLSFSYSLLSRETTLAAQSVGLDPLIGFYHQPRFGRASLALDLMEEFRPIIADSTVVTVINTGVITAEDFVRGQGAVNLTPAGRKKFIQAIERRLDQLVTHPKFDYRLSYRRVLEVQARLLSRSLLGEIPTYPGFRVR